MEDNKKIEFEMSKLILATYNKVALWNNNDYDTDTQKSDALKIVSHDIVQTALEEILAGLNVKTTTEVFRVDTKVGDSQVITDTKSFQDVDEKDILNKLFSK